jgi:hypothetical protein
MVRAERGGAGAGAAMCAVHHCRDLRVQVTWQSLRPHIHCFCLRWVPPDLASPTPKSYSGPHGCITLSEPAPAVWVVQIFRGLYRLVHYDFQGGLLLISPSFL